MYFLYDYNNNNIIQYRLPRLLSRKPLANGLWSILSCVICSFW